MKDYDVVILTDGRYIAPKKITPYIANILEEERLLGEALQKKGLRVSRQNWADPDFDWSCCETAIFRTTWNYSYQISAFMEWLANVKEKTRLINSYDMIRWNIDKHYLSELETSGVHIPPSIFIKKGDQRSLEEIARINSWEDMVLKPTIAAGARNTFRIGIKDISKYTSTYKDLISAESMILQEFQQEVVIHGEFTFMLFDGQYSHAVIKRAKAGDFRVQDDFGGKVYPYKANPEEIAFAEDVVSKLKVTPVYARVDAIIDNEGTLAVSELELFEPELWFRFHPAAADNLAESISHLM
jgi:glutathione synthase/RimK-type ligase-like ATP-grasp enzyme